MERSRGNRDREAPFEGRSPDGGGGRAADGRASSSSASSSARSAGPPTSCARRCRTSSRSTGTRPARGAARDAVAARPLHPAPRAASGAGRCPSRTSRLSERAPERPGACGVAPESARRASLDAGAARSPAIARRRAIVASACSRRGGATRSSTSRTGRETAELHRARAAAGRRLGAVAALPPRRGPRLPPAALGRHARSRPPALWRCVLVHRRGCSTRRTAHTSGSDHARLRRSAGASCSRSSSAARAGASPGVRGTAQAPPRRARGGRGGRGRTADAVRCRSGRLDARSVELRRAAGSAAPRRRRSRSRCRRCTFDPER